jgi:short-subunit dehydrogenase
MNYALITGASKGIGRAIAEALASKKYNILLVARTEETLVAVSNHLREKYKVNTSWLALDLSHPDAANQIFNWCTDNKYQVEVLVNNAGYGLSGPIEKYTVQETNDMLQVNINALVGLCRFFIPKMKTLPNAYILNIASTAAYQAVPLLTTYAAAKSFVLSFSRGLYHELKSSTVSVTCVSPGSTDTDFPYRARVSEKVINTAKKVHMSPQAVAQQAVKALFNRKPEVVTGKLNKLGAFLVWLLPKSLSEKTAMNIYK